MKRKLSMQASSRLSHALPTVPTPHVSSSSLPRKAQLDGPCLIPNSKLMTKGSKQNLIKNIQDDLSSMISVFLLSLPLLLRKAELTGGNLVSNSYLMTMCGRHAWSKLFYQHPSSTISFLPTEHHPYPHRAMKPLLRHCRQRVASSNFNSVKQTG